MKVAFETLGCKVNQYETEAMRALFVDAGYLPVAFDEVADVYVMSLRGRRMPSSASRFPL